MFISRLIQLFMMTLYKNIREISKYGSLSSNANFAVIDAYENNKIFEFDANQQAILNIIVKQSLLSITAIIPSQIAFIATIALIAGFTITTVSCDC